MGNCAGKLEGFFWLLSGRETEGENVSGRCDLQGDFLILLGEKGNMLCVMHVFRI